MTAHLTEEQDMGDLPMTIRDAAGALRQGELSSVELTRAMLARADRLDPQIGAYITRMDDSALAAAARADAAFAIGLDRGPLQGIPLGLKDILTTDDAPTTAQSLVMDPAWSAQGDGPVVSRLRQAGAVIMGKNSTMEFANGPPDDQKPFPVPRNPWNTEYWTGGSSSGTGAGIAAGLFLGGLGTDTGGSVRGPSAYCGITGMKQTFGRVPKSGCTQNGFSLDHIGPMARSAWDCAALLEVMAGFDATDINAAEQPVPRYADALDGDIRGLRVGVVRDNHTRSSDVHPDTVTCFEEAVRVLEEAGAATTEVTIPHYDVFATANWVNNVGKRPRSTTRLQERWEDWGRYTRVGNASFGNFLTAAADPLTAYRVRRYAQKVIAGIMRDVDVLVTPTAKAGATKIADIGYAQSPGFPMFTGVWSFTGLPALVVPMGFTGEGLPLSLQIVARPFDESTALKAGDAYQRLTDWHLRKPPVLAAETVTA
ncbi:MAG: amidase [Dehalococcoidia bacterium]|nr:amidase [Dehalococcoidia bacterium]